jgi:putative peptidoglycan binding protein/CHAP domain-containing protein
MSDPLKLGASGPAVRELQQLLNVRGYPCAQTGEFGTPTRNAVRAFQSQNLDQNGQPLVVDGKVGPLTDWSLRNPKPVIAVPAAVDYKTMPPDGLGGSPVGRRGLQAAIGELIAGAGEVGGNNQGPFVRKYLEPAGIAEGSSWCASFVSWCYLQAAGGSPASMAFPYCPGARALLGEFKDRGWASAPASDYLPVPGDLVFWWRVQAQGWQGHVGLVHQSQTGMLYTIEGNHSPNVQGFSYVLSRMEKLLGYGHVPG